MIASVDTLAPLMGIGAACELLGVPRSSLYRQRRAADQPPPPPQSRPRPKKALNPEEKGRIREVLNSERFQDQAPREVYASLIDEGVYLCSWRSMYRILEAEGEVRERRNQLRHPVQAKPQLVATAPNQVWTWDITQLPGPAKWLMFYLYVILDLFSRCVVGWLLAEQESAELARTLVRATCARQGLAPNQVTLHADHGGPMIAKSLAQLLIDLQVAKSHSRPHVPNDNPYSEAQFKTMKYQPNYPEHFESFAHAHAWAQDFFQWYNHEHHHTGLALLTPAIVHYGLAGTVLQARQQVLLDAYARHPERFVKGVPKPPQLPEAVWINPPKKEGPSDTTVRH